MIPIVVMHKMCQNYGNERKRRISIACNLRNRQLHAVLCKFLNHRGTSQPRNCTLITHAHFRMTTPATPKWLPIPSQHLAFQLNFNYANNRLVIRASVLALFRPIFSPIPRRWFTASDSYLIRTYSIYPGGNYKKRRYNLRRRIL